MSEDRIKHPVRTERAKPLVGRDAIVGLPERVDYKGASIRELDDAGCEAILVEAPPETPEWAGVRDRLARATG